MNALKMSWVSVWLAICSPTQAAQYFSGDVHNFDNGNDSQVSITIEEAGDRHFQAVGIFDNVTLFGRFNMPGEQVDCAPGESGKCLAFSGELELGDDD